MNFPTWAPVLAAAIAPVLLLLQAYRRFSGQVATTDASKLWEEATAMRVEYRTRIAELNEVIREREQRITDLEIRVAEVERENNNLHNVVGKLRRELSRHVDT